MLHHLDAGQKRQAVSEVFRTLRPGGELHLADFGPPSGPFTRLASFVITRLGHEYVEENLEGRIPRLMAEAGFEAVAETSAMATIFGTVRMYRGAKPTSSRIPSRDR
jgi:SAM-dependent methyltransferase